MTEQAERTVRTPVEIAGERATAEYKLGIAVADGDTFMQTHERAVLDALDWLSWNGPGEGPATGEWVAPDEGAVRRERRRARDKEHEHRGTDEAVRFHALGVTFGWYLLDSSVSMPA